MQDWNKLLHGEGLSVFRGSGKEIPLPPEVVERLRCDLRPRCPRKRIPLYVLSPRERDVIECLFYGGLSERETSRLLSISRSSVRSYRRSALRKLKDFLS